VTVGANLRRKVGGDEQLQVGAQHLVDVSGSAAEDALADRTLTVGGTHLIQVGNPAQAVLEVLKKAAITAATGAAASAASRAEAALLGPILPMVQKARAALGSATQITGPAAALLGGDHPKIAALREAAKSLADSPGAQDASDLASGLVAKALGDGGGDAAAEAAASATQGGSGLWSTVVQGRVTETVGGLCSINSIGGISLSVGGKSTETTGAARIEAIGGGKSESTKAAKLETVGGLYRVEVAEALSIQAGTAVAENVAGAAKHHVKGSHSVSAKQAVVLTAPKISLKANGTITLSCGATKVILESSKVALDGTTKLTLKGSKIDSTKVCSEVRDENASQDGASPGRTCGAARAAPPRAHPLRGPVHGAGQRGRALADPDRGRRAAGAPRRLGGPAAPGGGAALGGPGVARARSRGPAAGGRGADLAGAAG
jgi:type VI secretion system secreted protein VgrG